MKKKIAVVLAALFCCAYTVAFADNGWSCPSCGTYNQPDALFCLECAFPQPKESNAVSVESNAWVCPTCGRVRANTHKFCTADATPQTDSVRDALLLSTDKQANEYYAPDAIVDQYPVRVESKEGLAIPFRADVSGNYVIWATDSVDGYGVIAHFEDKNGNEVGQWPTIRSESLTSVNGQTFSQELVGGQEYTLVLSYDYTWSSFKAGSLTLNMARPKEVQYINDYDLIHDSIVCQRQENRYCFTPEVSGLYGLTCTEAYNGMELRIEAYDQLNNKVRSVDTYSNSFGMKGSLQYELQAGNIYTFYVSTAGKATGAYTLAVGRQNETADISGCEVVGDRLHFANQQNIYTYTAPATGEYEFDVTVMDRHSDCSIRVYDEFDYAVYSGSSWERSCKLQGGRSYRIVVTNNSKSDVDYVCEYVLTISQMDM